MKRKWLACLVMGVLLGQVRIFSADQPQWGHAWTRNLVSAERGLPAWFDPGTGRNLKWRVELGTESHASPVIAGGRIYIGTNNGRPRDPKHQGDRGVLMCLDEATGRLLWQLVVPKIPDDKYLDWPNAGICSPATVEGDRVYIVSNRGEVLCLDPLGLANGNDGPFTTEGELMTPPDAASKLEPGPLDADILWRTDLVTEAGIYTHDAAHSSILIRGDHLYLNSGTGVDNTHRKIRTPDAPALLVLDKRTGRVLARDPEFMAPNIFHNTWSSPSMASVNGREMIFFAAGNGIVYAYEPFASPPPGAPSAKPICANLPGAGLTRIWQFDFDPDAPKTNVHKYVGNRRESPSNFYGMPVFYRNRVYVAGGGDIWWGKNEAWLRCIRADGTGEVTKTGLVWSYPLNKHVMSTPVIANGLLFIADTGGQMHCVDPESGQAHWTHEILGEAWASPFVADGKVYLGTRRGQVYVFAAQKEPKLLTSFEPGGPISATATAANGVLYVTTMRHLYAAVETGDKP